MSVSEIDPDFYPLPLLGNPHVQTFIGALLPGQVCPLPERRYLVPVSEGDTVVLHENTPPRWKPHFPIALLVHGLTGSHASTHIRRMAALLLARQVRVFRIDLRGAGDALGLSRRTYHAGRSDDLRAALARIHQLAPRAPLWLMGVSLGGALSLKLAGEAASHPVPGLQRIAVINPPLDLARCAALLALPRNHLYERRFVRELVRDARRRQWFFPDLPPALFPRGLTLRGFDELYTAPRNGFSSAMDYYTRAAALPLIPHIQIPTYILTARDDPFIAVESFEELRAPNHIQVRILARGGHVGFVGWDGAGGIRWGERRVVDWITGGSEVHGQKLRDG